MKIISSNFKWNPVDAAIAKKLLSFEETPLAIDYFSKNCDKLTDYGYWFMLSTLWVSYSGWSDLVLWKKLFSADRPKKKTSIMKPIEVKQYDCLPWFVTIYRAHRENETDWIAYTLDKNIALRFAKERGAKAIKEYKVKKKDIMAIFLRRGEKEIIVLDKEKVKFVREHILLPKGMSLSHWKPQDKGYICLPLKKNIHNGQKDWVLVKCSICGRDCWESDLARKAVSHGNMISVCTECALKAGAKLNG